jgi:hypothetical protein
MGRSWRRPLLPRHRGPRRRRTLLFLAASHTPLAMWRSTPRCVWVPVVPVVDVPLIAPGRMKTVRARGEGESESAGESEGESAVHSPRLAA